MEQYNKLLHKEMESARNKEADNAVDAKGKEQKDAPFKVGVRIRPFTSTEIVAAESVAEKVQEPTSILKSEDNLVRCWNIKQTLDLYKTPWPTWRLFRMLILALLKNQKQGSYCFDHVFTETDSNRSVFNTAVEPLLDSVLSGINATCFAYGMTGSGKTHTMLGDIYHTSTGEAGVSTLAISEMFSRINSDSNNSYEVRMSYLEIYNEQVRDLLCVHKKSKYGPSLLIVEDPVKGVIVPELTEYQINSAEDLIMLTLKGNQQRTMGETKANQFSSRSHAIISVTMESRSRTRDVTDEVLVAKLCIVDLAGCERAAASDNKGLRMYEGGKINRSLLALGNCINMLSDKSKAGSSFIPYRDSKLTRLLKDSLGGNTKTLMLACVSPGENSYEETMNTLKYAERAKRINKRVTKNIKEVAVHVAQYRDIINSLKAEIESLKNQLQTKGGSGAVYAVGEDGKLELEAIDQEISKVKEQKANLEGERQDQEEAPVNEEFFDKLSAELLAKYEEQYEMKQSLHELEELNTKNQTVLGDLQLRLGAMKGTREDMTDFKGLENEIKTLKKNIESNEAIRKEIEASLQENVETQKRFVAAISHIKSHKKQDVIELQIAVRSLRLEKIDLVMQNLEMKKLAKLADMDREGKNKELELLKKELACVKEQLKGKEVELQDMRLSMNIALSARKFDRKKPVEIKVGKSSVQELIKTPTRKAIKNKSQKLLGTAKPKGVNPSPGSSMVINIKNLKPAPTKHHNTNAEKYLTNVPAPGVYTVVSPTHFMEGRSVDRASLNATELAPESPLHELEDRRKSLVGSHALKPSLKRPADKEKRETIYVKAVLSHGSYTQRAIKKRPEPKDSPAQPKAIAVNLRSYALQNSSAKAQKTAPSRPKRAKIVLCENASKGTGIPIGIHHEKVESPKSPRSPKVPHKDELRRSISLNLKVNKLRDKRKLEQTRKLEMSLEPMKEVIEDMASKIRQHMSNNALTGVNMADKNEEKKAEKFKTEAEDNSSKFKNYIDFNSASNHPSREGNYGYEFQY
eukprot:TRINITY_DN1804_c0_g1_i1.p1 TRINITY_DN1804_c0_g1~~TRINITY_DN1804_c0_g1_i1.p1  ORF type:complete len:1031 (-),score=110.84 TRINITY_DN1804_c0_g1_i1:3221-6313(-)